MAAYPRKQTVVIFLLCAFVVGGAATYVFGQNSSVAAASDQANLATAVADTGSQPLSDAIQPADTNWQKQFLTAAAIATSSKAAGSAGTVQKLTPVDVFSHNFLSQFLSLEQAGLTTDPDSVSSAVDQIVSQSTAAVTPPKTYSTKDVSVEPGTVATMRVYADSIDAIYKTYTSQPDEANIAAQAFENGDMSELPQLDPVIVAYQNMLARLAATPVPQPLIADHIDLLNSFGYLLYGVESFRHADTDPLTALSAARTDALGTQGISATFPKIKDYLGAQGIDVSY